MYEEIIQELEGDIRKHIRMEHQLKLHIESVEDRIEELERDMEKKDADIANLKLSKGQLDPAVGSDVSQQLKKELDKVRERHLKEISLVQADLQKLQNSNADLKQDIMLKDERLKSLGIELDKLKVREACSGQ